MRSARAWAGPGPGRPLIGQAVPGGGGGRCDTASAGESPEPHVLFHRSPGGGRRGGAGHVTSPRGRCALSPDLPRHRGRGECGARWRGGSRGSRVRAQGLQFRFLRAPPVGAILGRGGSGRNPGPCRNAGTGGALLTGERTVWLLLVSAALGNALISPS